MVRILSRYNGIFLDQFMNGASQIEDTQQSIFRNSSAMDKRSGTGIRILDADHHALDPTI